MIKRLIRNIRQQPKGTRDGVAFAVASIFSLMVFSVWAFNAPDRLADIQQSTTTKEDSSGSSLGDIFGGVKEQFASVVDSIPRATSTQDTVSTSSTNASTSIVMPDVDKVREQMRQESNESSETSGTTTRDQSSEEASLGGGREVRIITTQSTSSASSTRP